MPTTTTPGFSPSALLQPIAQAGATALTNLLLRRPAASSGLFSPSTLLGTGLTLGSAALSREPGTTLEARQSLRNLLTPESQTGQFTGYVNRLKEQFQPLLNQQRQRDIADIQQRFIAAFPKTVGAQGPEFGTLGRYISNEALPREQSFLGQLGLEGLDRQRAAAATLLSESNKDAFADALGQLGGVFLLRDALHGTDSRLLGQDGSLLGSVGADGTYSPVGGEAGAALGSQALSSLSQLLGERAAGTAANPGGGTAILDEAGRTIGIVGADGTVSHLTKGVVGKVGAPAARAGGFKGVLGLPGTSSTAGIASGVASALGGGLVGYKVGTELSKAFEARHAGRTSTAGTAAIGGAAGAASGAATGALIGDGPGAVIGAIIGGLAGGIGGAGAERRREQANIKRETQLTGSQRPEALQAASDLLQNSRRFEADAKAVIPRLEAPLDQLIQSGDPEIRSIIEATRALGSARSGTQVFDSPTGVPLANQQNPPADAVLRRLLREVGEGEVYDPASASNPESSYGLLQSSEVGKFQPGFDRLQRTIQSVNQAQQLFQRLITRVGGG